MKIFSIILYILLLFLSITSLAKSNNMYKNKGIILGTKVNVRNKPTTKAKVITVVKEGENVQILEWSNSKEKIGNYTDKWVKIKTNSNKIGYLFGAFIFDLDDLINNKWYLQTYSGEVYGFILEKGNKFSIIAGEAEVGEEPKIIKSGTYEIKERKISFSKKIGGHSQKKTNALYLFRYKGKNVLLEHKYHIDDRTFIPPNDGIPWGWWKE